ncbi:hypothetical protein IIB79_11080 [candidate division KSB1 bacterium]|nr:hypothetical protein [candidate division KSB1 bacterium]
MTLKLFRQDEIWFMDREDGSSKLYPLSDFPVRHDKDIRKAYKHGIFGAIPALTEHVLEL